MAASKRSFLAQLLGFPPSSGTLATAPLQITNIKRNASTVHRYGTRFPLLFSPLIPQLDAVDNVLPEDITSRSDGR